MWMSALLQCLQNHLKDKANADKLKKHESRYCAVSELSQGCFAQLFRHQNALLTSLHQTLKQSPHPGRISGHVLSLITGCNHAFITLILYKIEPQMFWNFPEGVFAVTMKSTEAMGSQSLSQLRCMYRELRFCNWLNLKEATIV